VTKGCKGSYQSVSFAKTNQFRVIYRFPDKRAGRVGVGSNRNVSINTGGKGEAPGSSVEGLGRRPLGLGVGE